ncbi:MAG: ABC transporter substrate-binding protein [Peptococcaceae bacterium]|nr:ABC transporter substrate-binding protein [Peptococcaceae bacterium]
MLGAKKILTLFFAIFLVVGLLAGCAQQAKEKNRKTLVVGEIWDIRGLDVAGHDGTLVKEKAMIAETLVEANPDFTLKPGLAKSWEQVGDTQWKFHLREGVKFHDGKELTADAVKWSIERALKVDPTLKELTRIKSIEAVDKNTLLFTTEEPYAAFPASLAYAGMGIVSPSSEMDEKGVISRPVGTGPFKVEKWDTATGTVDLVRNDSYWGAKPKLEKIIMKGIPDPASRSMAVEKGEIDFTCDVPYADLKRIQNTSGIKLDASPTARVYQLTFGKLSGTPYSDVRVRKAISYAIDRNVIAEKTLHGAAAPASGPIMPSIQWANKNLKGYSYDPEKAKALLAEAGWKDADGDGILEKNGEKFSITLYTYPQRPGLQPMAEAIQSMLKEVGIKVEVRVMDSSAINEQMRDKDMRLSANAVMMIPDPDYYLRRTYHSKGSNNKWGYSNPEMDSLLEQGLKTFDAGKRQEIYNRVQEIAVDEVPLIHVAYYKAAIVMRDYVQNFVFNPVAHDYMLNPEMDVVK